MARAKIPGGSKIGDKHDTGAVNQRELAMGRKVEAEHTTDPAFAEEIALDHLDEDPGYYGKGKKRGMFPELANKTMENKAQKIVYTLLETGYGDVDMDAMPPIPVEPKVPHHDAPMEAWSQYEKDMTEFREKEAVFDEWVDRRMDAAETENHEEDDMNDESWNEYIATHQGHLMPGAEQGRPRAKSAPMKLIPLADKMEHAVFEYGNFVFIKMPANEDFIKQEGILMNHPVSGDTKVVTYNGIVPINSLSGKETKFLTRVRNKTVAAWANGSVKSFGNQPIVEVVLTRTNREVVVKTTAEHRWYALTTRNKKYMRLLEMTTADLKPGFRIPSVYAKPVPLKPASKGVTLSAVGVMHGVVFGDGHTTVIKQGETVRGSQITLYGKKDAELVKWFPETTRRKVSARSIGGITLFDLPRYYKQLPDINESPAYLLGWLAGYIAADGNVAKNGRTSLASCSEDNLRFAELVCLRLGIHTLGISKRIRTGFGKTCALYSLSFEIGAIPSDLYLISAHRERVKAREKSSLHWTVKAVRKTDKTEEVFCAIVPETGCFVLEGNILTGNCLAFDYARYAERLRSGSQIQFSMVDKRDERPKVDMEVSLTQASYAKDRITHPVVTQIRGIRNQCPPADEYIEPIIQFFATVGKGWQLTGHGVKNFDNECDGEKLVNRWKELKNAPTKA